jgi:transposase-like protein
MIEAQNTIYAQEPRDVLDEICRQGARQMLQAALENEVTEYLAAHATHCDDSGRQAVIRNGYLPEREIVSGVGPLPIRQPRVRHKEKDSGERFTSRILPPYLRRVPSIDALIPALYLKGVSTGDFSEALAAILGEGAAGLSATNIVRLKKVWEEEYRDWSKRDLSAKHYVYLWADGIYFNVRLESDRICMLVLIGALPDGTKELVAILDGFRESADSWAELLRDLKQRGLRRPPALAVGDGALGFWKALDQVFAKTRRQRCWVHKTANILDKMPKSVQPHAKMLIHEMYMAPTKEDALDAYQKFLEKYQAKYPRACDCLEKDFDDLFTFYDFPAEHWQHLRTTNPIESTFATVRLRTRRTKGCGSTAATLTMTYKLGLEAQQHWRRLNGSQQIAKILEGRRFVNGVQEEEKAA